MNIMGVKMKDRSPIPVGPMMSKCAYVEFVLGRDNNVLEYPCDKEATHDIFCEEHKHHLETTTPFWCESLEEKQ